jgi:ceramide glucosyltransferase
MITLVDFSSIHFSPVDLSPLEMGLLILIAASTVFYLACAWFTQQFFADDALIGWENTSPPPVSLLVPVCGLDAGAWENWLSLCTQNYPDYEVLFGVVDPEDPAMPTLQELEAKYPERVRIFTGLTPLGMNYKDSSLSYLLTAAHHELIVFADSDICVQPNYLEIVTAPLADPQVGIVTCAYISYKPKFLGAAIASLGRCCDFIPSILIALGIDRELKFAIGVTMATRQSTLKDFGGLHLNRIGSDYNLGKRAAAAGYRVELSPYILDSDTGKESIWDVFRRELRWARTIRFNRGWQYYTMVFCYGTTYGLALVLVSGFAPWAILVGTINLCFRYAQAGLAIHKIGCPKLATWLWLLPLRDLLSFAIWVAGAFGQRVYWRGRYLRVEGDGLLTGK